MGSFFNTVFSILLGWLQGIVSMIWNAFTLREGESFLEYIGKNWIIIALILCTVGLMLDFAVYYFRWEPYKVWRTTWRKIRKKRKDRNTEEANRDYSPDYENEDMKFSEQENNTSGLTVYDTPEEEDELRRWREDGGKDSIFPGAVPPDVTKAGYVVPADSPYRRPSAEKDESGTERINSSGNRVRRHRRLFAILGDADEENQFLYFAPKPMINQRDAYRDPVYPEKWKESREEDT